MEKYNVPPNSSNPRKTYNLTPEEITFLDSLLEKSEKLKGEFQLSRLSNGTINVSYNGYPVGKIKLQGRTKTMTALINLYDSKSIEGDISIFVKEIDSWISYIKRFLTDAL